MHEETDDLFVGPYKLAGGQLGQRRRQSRDRGGDELRKPCRTQDQHEAHDAMSCKTLQETISSTTVKSQCEESLQAFRIAAQPVTSRIGEVNGGIRRVLHPVPRGSIGMNTGGAHKLTNVNYI